MLPTRPYLPLLLLSLLPTAHASPALTLPQTTQPALLPTPTNEGHHPLQDRDDDDDDDILTRRSRICGYVRGDPFRPRLAAPGYDCTVDAVGGAWGFCAEGKAGGCALARACVDEEACKGVCGEGEQGRTLTCAGKKSLCSIVTLMASEDAEERYTYNSCNRRAVFETYYQVPIAVAATATSTTTKDGAVPSSGSSSAASHVAPLQTSDQEDEEEEEEENPTSGPTQNTAAIVGGVVGGAALICAVVAATTLYIRRERRMVSRGGRRSPNGTGASSMTEEPNISTFGKAVPVVIFDGKPCEMDASVQPVEMGGPGLPHELGDSSRGGRWGPE